MLNLTKETRAKILAMKEKWEANKTQSYPRMQISGTPFWLVYFPPKGRMKGGFQIEIPQGNNRRNLPISSSGQVATLKAGLNFVSAKGHSLSDYVSVIEQLNSGDFDPDAIDVE